MAELRRQDLPLSEPETEAELQDPGDPWARRRALAGVASLAGIVLVAMGLVFLRSRPAPVVIESGPFGEVSHRRLDPGFVFLVTGSREGRIAFVQLVLADRFDAELDERLKDLALGRRPSAELVEALPLWGVGVEEEQDFRGQGVRKVDRLALHTMQHIMQH